MKDTAIKENMSYLEIINQVAETVPITNSSAYVTAMRNIQVGQTGCDKDHAYINGREWESWPYFFMFRLWKKDRLHSIMSLC